MYSPAATLETGGDQRNSAAALPEFDLVDLLCGQREGDGAPRMAGLLASWHPVGRTLHLRRWHRIPLEVPVIVALWDERGGCPPRAWPAVVRDVCPGGMSFTHAEPISTRRVAILLRDSAGQAAGWLVRLTWCRFTRRSVYQSGGAVVRLLEGAEVRAAAGAD